VTWWCNTKHIVAIVSELQPLVLLQHQVRPSMGEGSEGKEKGVKSADLVVAD